MANYNSGPSAYAWRGGRYIDTQGYVMVYAPEHPRARPRHVPEHIIIAEKALGRFLPEGVVVHHGDENRSNNARSNLVICQDDTYHKLLHRRLRAYKACGNANARRCEICRQWDTPDRMTIREYGGGYVQHTYHKACAAAYQRGRRKSNG